MENVYEQKRLSRRLRFTFEDEVVRAEVEDAAEAFEFSVPYVEIPFESQRVTEKMEALRGVTIVFIVLAIVSTLAAITNPMVLVTVAVQLGLAAAAWIAYKQIRGTFTIIDTDRGRLLILDDENHDEILGELESRRRDLLRSHFAEVNPDNDPTHESHKFDWLRRNGVITDEEYQERMAEIEGKPALPSPSGPKTVH